jgi:hypothetical protein
MSMSDENEVNGDGFNVPASDAKGHSERLWVRCQPQVLGQIERVMSSKVFPYRTRGDLIRHALIRHLKWLDSQEGVRIKSVMAEVDVINEILREEQSKRETEDVVNRMSDTVSMFLSRGASQEAKRLVVTVLNQINNMPEGYWRESCRQAVYSRYGYLLKEEG